MGALMAGCCYRRYRRNRPKAESAQLCDILGVFGYLITHGGRGYVAAETNPKWGHRERRRGPCTHAGEVAKLREEDESERRWKLILVAVVFGLGATVAGAIAGGLVQ